MSKNFESLRRLNGNRLTMPLPAGTNLDQWSPALRHERQTQPPPAEEESNWLRAWMIFRKHWALSALFAGTVMLFVLLFTVLAQPVYEPRARLEIAPPGAELFRLDGHENESADATYLETQARELESEGLAIAVVRKLDLAHNKEFMAKGRLSRVMSHLPTLPTVFGYQGRPQHRATHAAAVTLSPEEEVAFERLKTNLKVERDTSSRLITVSFSGPNPELAAQITNTVAQLFVDRSYQTRHEAIMHSTEWLSRQLDDIRTKMDESNRAVADFQRANSITDVDHDHSTISDQVADLSRQKSQAEAERIQLEAYLGKARKGNLNGLPQVQESPVVQQLSQKLAESRLELSEATASMGDNHPTVRKLRNGVDELESELRLQREAILEKLETSYTAALSREHMIGNEIKGAAKELQVMAQYTALKREAQNNTELYNTLYARTKEAGIAAASVSSNVRVVDEARVLDSPTGPKALLNLGLGCLVAFIGAAVLPFMRERIDHRLHDAGDVQRWTGLSSVAIMPLAQDDDRTGDWRHLLTSSKRGTAVDCAPSNFLLNIPESAQAEAVRGLETAVLFSGSSRPPQMVLVASSVSGEGKTTMAINLASALAQHAPTCIIDADLRRSQVGRAFNVHESTGLAQYLAGLAAFEEILFAAPNMANLVVMPAGALVQNPGTLIRSVRMRELLVSVRHRYEYVVIDCPPILFYADGRALSPLVDGIVFVARAGEVTRDAILRSMELLNQVHSAPILQVVVNGAEEAMPSYGRYYDRAVKAS